MTSTQFIDGIGRLIDLVGVLAIAAGVLLAGGQAVLRLARREQLMFGRFRREVGRGILLRLELLADRRPGGQLTPVRGADISLGRATVKPVFGVFS